MIRAIGWLDMLLGAFFLFLGIVALGGSPAAWQNLAAEPEDFYGLLFLSLLCAGIGTAAILVGWVLVRGGIVWKISPTIASGLCAMGVALLLVVSIMGFWPNDPGSGELRLLLVPAVPLGISCLLLRRKGAMQREGTPKSQ